MRRRRDAFVAAVVVAAALAPSVAGAQQPTSAATPAEALGAVQGVVYDSLTHRPLAGAIVQSVRTGDIEGSRAVTADAAGAFRIDSLAPGRYLVGFSHPLLDLLRVEAMPRLVAVGPGGEAVRVDLGVPDLARVRPVVCGSPQAPTDSTGLLAGSVRDAVDDMPVANAKVVLTWSEVTFGTGGVRTEHRRVPVTTDPNGRYVVCGLPPGEELVATAAAAGRETGLVALVVPPRGFVMRDLTLGDTVSGAAATPEGEPKGREKARGKGSDSAAVTLARGAARLTGTVRDSSGRPIRGARATVWGTASAATVDADGGFTLGGLPAGTHTLEVRAIGFTIRRMPVDLATGRTGTQDVRLERVTDLAPVTVFGTPSEPSQRTREFLDRKAHNTFGRYVTADEIERRHPSEVSDALRGVAGLQIMPGGQSGNVIIGRAKGTGSCRAVVILDGTALKPNDVIDRWVSPQGVAGIEVYADPAYAPPQYGGAASTGCSVVLIWTR